MIEVEIKLEVSRDIDPGAGLTGKSIPQMPQNLPQPVKDFFNMHSAERYEYQHDVYYQHPCWDMRDKDLVLRNRNKAAFKNSNSRWIEQPVLQLITYKGPKTIDASGIKSREESEFKVPEKIWPVFENLGFTRAVEIKKGRFITSLKNNENINYEICLDMVAGLGIFLEVEVTIESTTTSADAALVIENFLKQNHLTGFKVEKRSYADLIENS